MQQKSNQDRVSLTRRRFVQGLAAGGVAAAFGIPPSQVTAAYAASDAPVLRGTEFDLVLGGQAVNFTGATRSATTVNGSLPAPLLRWREGDTVTLRVTNRLREASSIHWHGIILPADMDGVPGISPGFHGIEPGATFTYRFPVRQSGTYWYHSHSGWQEQTGLYGPIIIEPRAPDPVSYDREHVVLLSDWTDTPPAQVYATLKKLSHYYNVNERTHADLMADLKSKGLAATWAERAMWSRMRMSESDISDVTGYTYTFLMNGRTPAQGWLGQFQPGERVRLRFINGSAMTLFDVRIPGLEMTVVAADGQNIQPVTVEEFRLGVAETYDVIVEPAADRAYTLFAQDIARTGYACGTLTPDPALSAPMPPLDAPEPLTHADMGMGGEGHAGHATGGVEVDGHAMAMDGMDHGQHTATPAAEDHNQHATAPVADDHGEQVAAPMEDHSEHMMMPVVEDHSQHLAEPPAMAEPPAPHPSDFSRRPVTHAATEYGPQVDMRAEDPQYRLDDPGVGLRNSLQGNGRRVLTYADLKSLRPTHLDPPPEREIELHLTGNMARYMWSIDGVKHTDAAPLRWRLGERLRITFVNDTMMSHPMHLHGMWSDVETGDNNNLPRKHTVIVQPGSRLSVRVTADAEGPWAFHCHLLYHMPGMFRTVIVGQGGVS